MNSGIDPELIANGTIVAAYHLENGIRTFVEFAKVMLSDFGEQIKPYLQSFYEGARHYPNNPYYRDMDDVNLIIEYVDNNFEKLNKVLNGGIDEVKTPKRVPEEVKEPKTDDVDNDRYKAVQEQLSKALDVADETLREDWVKDFQDTELFRKIRIQIDFLRIENSQPFAQKTKEDIEKINKEYQLLTELFD